MPGVSDTALHVIVGAVFVRGQHQFQAGPLAWRRNGDDALAGNERLPQIPSDAGLLKRWARSTDGQWFGHVNFKITDSLLAEVAEHVSVLVPAHALKPRS